MLPATYSRLAEASTAIPAGYAPALPRLVVRTMRFPSLTVCPVIVKVCSELPTPSDAHAREPSGENASPA